MSAPVIQDIRYEQEQSRNMTLLSHRWTREACGRVNPPPRGQCTAPRVCVRRQRLEQPVLGRMYG